MSLYLLAISLGIIAASFLPVLPPFFLVICVVVAIAMVLAAATVVSFKRGLWRKRWVLVFTCAVAGASWGAVHGLLTMQALLPVALEGEDILLTGVVDSLPQQSHSRGQFVQRFELRVMGAQVYSSRELLPAGLDRVLFFRPLRPGRWDLAEIKPKNFKLYYVPLLGIMGPVGHISPDIIMRQVEFDLFCKVFRIIPYANFISLLKKL